MLIIRLLSQSVTLIHKLTSVPHHTETIQLICRANQLTRFYLMGNIGR